MQPFLSFLSLLQVSHGHLDLLYDVCCQTCTDSHTDCLKTRQSDSVQNVKCGWCKGFVDPLSPKMTSSPPDQEWSSHLVGACAGPCGWTVDIPRQRRTRRGANRYRRSPIKALKEKKQTLLCEFFVQQLVG